ncbi:MAG: DUF805 domain-containing protein [Bacteroidales bacterium]|jgi:uncharacterized membrane protein YhaH (DUF805 family)|nr:DUF805 domain-containing protein [Bacteroidales bacterium]
MNYFIKCLKNYAVFTGRARRKEYWLFYLFYVIFLVVAMVLDNVLGIASKTLHYGPIYGVFCLALLVPTLAVSVRRLHDIGKSGWWMLIFYLASVVLSVLMTLLITVVPFIVFFVAIAIMAIAIWMLIWVCKDSQMGDNQYGEYPK